MSEEVRDAIVEVKQRIEISNVTSTVEILGMHRRF